MTSFTVLNQLIKYCVLILATVLYWLFVPFLLIGRLITSVQVKPPEAETYWSPDLRQSGDED